MFVRKYDAQLCIRAMCNVLKAWEATRVEGMIIQDDMSIRTRFHVDFLHR